VLAEGFLYEAHRVPLIGPQGIFKRAGSVRSRSALQRWRSSRMRRVRTLSSRPDRQLLDERYQRFQQLGG
jgi:hypothetical protein